MKLIISLLTITAILSSCAIRNGNTTAMDNNYSDWMDDYDKIIAGLELKIENSASTFQQGEALTIQPILYASGKMVEKNDTVSGEIFSNYEIRYTIDKELHLDSVYTNHSYVYFTTGLADKIVIEQELAKGSHFVSINCQFNSDAGFNKQIRKEIIIK